MRVVLKLTRWQEFVPFTVPLTLLGGLMAYRLAENVSLDERLLLVMIANCLAVGYAFMINDIEDAEDDKHDPERAKRNVISAGLLDKRQGWWAAGAVAGLAGLFYGLAGQWAFVNGAAILILAQLYSWKPIRLKALPVVDVVSHILMLSGLLLLAAYMAYDPSPTEALTVATSVTLMSAYGQLYNQLRDFEADQAAGLRNTASFLGQQLTIWLSYACVGVAALTLAWAILVEQIFPFWLAGVVIVVAPAVLFISRGRDMRGDTAAGVQGDAQVQFLVIANLVLLAWLGVALVQG